MINAMWDESRLWMTQAQADETIKKLVAANIDTFMPCIWHGRGVTWPSAIVPEKDHYWNVAFDQDFPDPLAYLLDACHDAQIKVYPWFTVALNQFPQNEYAQFVDGPPDTSFNVHRPEFRAWIHSIMLEAVRNYAIDGLILDYIRSGYGTAQYQQDDYAAKTGRNLLTDWANWGSDQTAFDSIVGWRAAAVELIVKNIRSAARAVRPDLPIHVYGSPGSSDLQLQGQDVVKWVNAGWTEALWDGASQPPETLDRTEIDYAMQNLDDTSKYFMLADNYVSGPSPATGQQFVDLIEIGLALPKSQGIGIYLLEQLTDEQIVSLRAGPFR